MKTRSFISILISIVLVLLLVGGAGAYWLVSRNPLSLIKGVEQVNPEASVFLSRQSPLVVSLLVHPDRLTAFGLAVTPPTQRKQVQEKWQRFRQSVVGDRLFNYQKDIQPWLGNELTFAVTTPDIDRDVLNGEQPGYLLAASIRNLDKANQSLQTYWQRQAAAGVDLIFEQFAGVNLVYRQSSQTSTLGSVSDAALATAIVGDRFVLFANHPKVLRDALNNLQVPELSLSRSESYQQALQQLVQQPHVGLVFVHLPQFAAWLSDTDARSSSLPPPDSEITFDSILMALRLDDQGIIADTQLLTAPDRTIKPSPPQLMQPVFPLQYIPANSPLVAAGQNLHQDWSSVLESLQGYESLQKLLHQPLDSLAQQWGIEPEEIISSIQDEYALGLLPQADGTQVSWLFITKQSPELSDRLAQLDEKARQQGISIGRFTVADQSVTAWTKLSTLSRSPDWSSSRKSDRKSDRSPSRESMSIQATVQGVHASVAGYEIFATSLDAIAQCLESSQNSLVATDRFQQEIAALPTPNNGYLFIDWQALQESIPSASSPFPRLKGRLAFLKPAIEALRTITFSSHGSSATAAKGTLFLRL